MRKHPFDCETEKSLSIVFLRDVAIGACVTGFVVKQGQILATISLSKHSSKLVDPASDHILRSKTKPCMSKTKQVVSESAYGSINEP